MGEPYQLLTFWEYASRSHSNRQILRLFVRYISVKVESENERRKNLVSRHRRARLRGGLLSECSEWEGDAGLLHMVEHVFDTNINLLKGRALPSKPTISHSLSRPGPADRLSRMSAKARGLS